MAEVPGLVWKTWTGNQVAGEAGGIDRLTDISSAQADLAMHTTRLNGFGIVRVNGKILAVNEALSQLDPGPV